MIHGGFDTIIYINPVVYAFMWVKKGSHAAYEKLERVPTKTRKEGNVLFNGYMA